jgi:hypothetical protein
MPSDPVTTRASRRGTAEPVTAAGVVALVVTAVLAGGLVLGGLRAAADLPLPRGSVSRVLVAGAGQPRADVAAGQASAVHDLFARRAAAVVRRDARAYRATQVARSHSPAFDRLVALHLVRWSYSVTSLTPRPGGRILDVDVRLVTRLAGEAADATTFESVALLRTGSGWRVSQERTRGPRAALWDLGAVTVVRGSTSVVVGIASPRSLLRAYAASADRAVSAVSSMWGRRWDRRVVLVVPRTTAMLARLLGRTTASLSGFAAVTTAEGDARSGRDVAEHVYVNAPAVATLSDLGRDVVVRHELTHVATQAPARSTVPLWLVEGAAEYTGYRGSGIPLPVAVGDLVGAARTSGVPPRLPAPADFAGGRIDVAYESAHLACALLVQKYGEAAFVRLYRLTETGTAGPDDNLAAALRSVTGLSVASFQKSWRSSAAALSR